MRIKSKLMLLGIMTILCCAFAMVVVGIWQGRLFSQRAGQEAQKLIDADLDHITESVYNLIKSQDESIQQKVNHDLNVARYVLSQEGQVSFSGTMVKWTATNQFNAETSEVTLPQFLVGGKWLGMNRNLTVETPVVDKVKRLVGGTATIFQRMNDQGDMLRVATNVEKLDGTRAIGTYIPARNPDGQPNPVISAIMKGEVYRGIAYVVNAWYVTAYEPIIDSTGKVIGVLYVGVRQENIDSLRQGIMKVRLGKTGYIFVLGGKGSARGKYVISKDGLRDGVDVWDEKDTSGAFVVQSIINKAVALNPGEFATIRYQWKNPGETEPRWKIARIAYYDPWDWVIGASVYEDELDGSLVTITAGYWRMLYGIIIVAVCSIIIGGIFTWQYARHLTDPLTRVTETARELVKHDFPSLTGAIESVERGDFSVHFTFHTRHVDAASNDEIGVMADTFNSMNAVLETVAKSFNRMTETMRDLTNRLEDKVQERTAELRESERRLHDIIDFLPEGTVVIDTEGKVVAWNKSMENLTGVTSSAILGKGDYEYSIPLCGKRRPMLIDFLHLTDEETSGYGYSNLKRTQETIEGEMFSENLPGGQRYLLGTARGLYDSKNNLVGAIEIIRDITDRKRAEEALEEAKEQAESANKAKSMFLAMMSHEIRTPMNGILGMTNILLQGDLSEKQRDYASTIRDSGEALLTIINDILDFSKIEAGKLDIELRAFPLLECVEGVVELVAPKASEKGLELICHIDRNTPAVVISDASRIRQILLNLLSNSIKFTAEGEVSLFVSAMKIQKEGGPMAGGGYPDNYEIRFSIKDTGIGIPPDRVDRLFKSFSQVDSSMTRKYGGTGLGLAISKALAELMGGTIIVESEESKGSTFHLVIRTMEVRGLTPEHQHPGRIHLRGKRVLIIDDHPTNRKVLGLQLESWNMPCIAVNSGHEAIDLLGKGEVFEVILTDMMMPDLSGTETTAAIRSMLGTLSPPIILLSSSAQDFSESEKGMFAAILNKPAKSSTLYNVFVDIFGDAPAVRKSSSNIIKTDDSGMARAHPLRILIAEDNPTNQRLALLNLEQFGYDADVVSNGLEAIDALKGKPFDVVLMDIQMPELDGLQTTGRIRGEFPSERQPFIIALTANAMDGDRQECMRAGMDDYISKPFTPDELKRALIRAHGKAGKRYPAVRPEPVTAAETGSLNPSAITRLRSTLGKRVAVVLPELIDTFLRDADVFVGNARGYVRDNNAPELRRAAHTLKGNLYNFGADALAPVLQELEQLAKEGDLTGTNSLIDRVEAEYPIYRAAIVRLKEDIV